MGSPIPIGKFRPSVTFDVDRLGELATVVPEASVEAIRREFRELYFPSQPAWRQKALADGRQAFEGILRLYGLLV